MKYIKTAELREELLSKIQHRHDIVEITLVLDDYVDSIISNYEEDAKKQNNFYKSKCEIKRKNTKKLVGYKGDES